MTEHRVGTRLPRATYRLQLVPERGFAYAASLCDYLAELGVSHLYLSPSLEAVPGSQHGYDVTDPGRIRAELGGPEGLEQLRDAARAAGLGLVLDIVPNHVGLVSPWNPWWWDVLQHGPHGRYGRHLDVLWREGAHGQPTLLLPELGGTLEEELAGDELQLAWGEEPIGAAPVGWRVVYHEHVWPVRPGSLAAVGLDEGDRAATLGAATDRATLASLLDHQHYRLACWLDANDHLDHRRFFAVSTLGGVRIEDPEVFGDAHAAILPLVQDGTVDGLRIDHPDGLTDPAGYLERLRDAIGPEPWLIVEKILERGERFRTDWPVDGTVGYELADVLLKLHADPAGVATLDELHTQLTGTRLDRVTAAVTSQRFVLDTMFGTEVRRLTDHLLRATDELDASTAHEVVTELLVAWPTYRTYVRPDTGKASETDREVVAHAVSLAGARRPELTAALDHVAALLTTDGLAAPGTDARQAQEAFVWRFQQQTGPAIAKGFEDTVLYRDLRFTAVNEVGSDPGHVDTTIGELHELHVQVQHDRPATMRLSSTHDTKRSADVRARLVTLSQDADHWVRTVHRWRELAAPHRGELGPTPSHEHLVLQTLVGAWPIDRQRLEDYLRKAVREGGEATDHLHPNERYEAELFAYVTGLLDDERFVDELETVVDQLAPAGWTTSLAMLLVTLTAPGVPDVYQGDELWDLSLVDPDNRRPVDHAQRRALLAQLRDAEPEEVLDRLDEGLPKLHLVQRALDLRARRPEAFGPGATYQPRFATGERSQHVLAYDRSDTVVAVAPVRTRQLGPRFADWAWGDTSVPLPDGRWHDVLTDTEVAGGEQRVADVLRHWPVALLERR